ncbi:hypothetical protein NDU88_009978 [Pleurodeles waltl]|uniref:Uncharacterized protein n=1 Tax=Pleurodeles waltl TaxID=8319 RepID=A0AAV7S2K6_PLEWA|nr:hypothetical protein NDU88_009978 [Pleurodeles waltl]
MLETSVNDIARWAQAEEKALQMEEAQGDRLSTIASLWMELVDDLKFHGMVYDLTGDESIGLAGETGPACGGE